MAGWSLRPKARQAPLVQRLEAHRADDRPQVAASERRSGCPWYTRNEPSGRIRAASWLAIISAKAGGTSPIGYGLDRGPGALASTASGRGGRTLRPDCRNWLCRDWPWTILRRGQRLDLRRHHRADGQAMRAPPIDVHRHCRPPQTFPGGLEPLLERLPGIDQSILVQARYDMMSATTQSPIQAWPTLSRQQPAKDFVTRFEVGAQKVLGHGIKVRRRILHALHLKRP